MSKAKVDEPWEARLDTTLAGDGSFEHSATDRRHLALLWVFPKVQCHMLEVGRGPWRIGREPGCEIGMDDSLTSREHARLTHKGPLVVLKDLGSRNGTFVQGTRIQEVPVGPGMVLRLGNHVGIFVLAATERPPEFFQLREFLPGAFAGATFAEILDQLRRVASTNLPVVIYGPTGTGKERVAEFLHVQSGRSGPFHAVNCAAIPAELAESELFGHRQGAFTGAKDAQLGHFRAAHAGTLFLDEIAELPRAVQAKLLRVIQEQKVMALGETRTTTIDVRIVAACQRPLEHYVAANQFRADLQARLSGLVVTLPALAERVEEIPLLFLRILEKHSAGAAAPIDGKLIERLCLHDWPGNVRELEFVARQILAVHGHEDRFKVSHLPATLRYVPLRSDEASTHKRLQELERLARALRDAGGNITRASAALKISRAAAYRLMDGLPIADVMARYAPGDCN